MRRINRWNMLDRSLWNAVFVRWASGLKCNQPGIINVTKRSSQHKRLHREIFPVGGLGLNENNPKSCIGFDLYSALVAFHEWEIGSIWNLCGPRRSTCACIDDDKLWWRRAEWSLEWEPVNLPSDSNINQKPRLIFIIFGGSVTTVTIACCFLMHSNIVLGVLRGKHIFCTLS